jgi:hypothetical protein
MTTISNSQKHLYPQKIALRAQRLIQGALFYDVFTDTATWLYAKTNDNAEQTVKDSLIKTDGWSEETYETSWECFKSYLEEFQNPIYQHTVYSIISHWDWYISNLGKFIYFAVKQIYPEKETNKDLMKLSFKPFATQIEIIKNETGIMLNIDSDTLDLVEEMHLVRNLGMHNEWEIDGTYLKKTKTKDMKLGDKRAFEIEEITKWHAAFIQLVGVLSSEIAMCYSQAPKFE